MMVASSVKVKDPAVDMETPVEIEIRSSTIDTERLGLWSKKLIKKGSRFGPFIGDKALEVDDHMDPTYIWEIVDVDTKEFLFYINATDPKRGNWMRYINCARYYEEQNIVSEQDGIDIFFEAIKDIEPGEELLTWYEKSPLRKKKGKKRAVNHVRRAKRTISRLITEMKETETASSSGTSISQRGRRRSAKKYWKIEENVNPREVNAVVSVTKEHAVAIKTEIPEKSVQKESTFIMDPTCYFEFEMLPVHTGKNGMGRKMFHCDVCSGVYRHGFSLKRHYLRNHINRRYISRVDAMNCGISLQFDSNDKTKEQSTSITHEKGDKRVEKISVSDCNREKTITTSTSADDESGTATLQLEVDEIDEADQDLKHNVDASDFSKSSGIAKKGTSQSAEKITVHNFPGLYRCYICEAKFDTVAELKTHFSSGHSTSAEKRFSCRHCLMQFKHRQNLVRHEVVHSGAKPYICDHCNKRFPTMTNRRRHERIHRGTRLACPLCSSSFTQTGDLKKHIRRQHPESYRACAFCPRYFTADSQLSVHLRRSHPGTDLEANRRRAIAQRDTHSAALEADRAESRRLASSSGVADSVSSTSASASGGLFACTVCCKSFADYANMCRHRRLAHGCGIRGQDLDGSSSDDHDDDGGELLNGGGGTASGASHWVTDHVSSTSVSSVDTQQAFYAAVSKNIATNLNHHLMGKSEQVAHAASFIRWRQSGNSAANLAQSSAGKECGSFSAAGPVRLEDFNFPPGFKIRPLAELYEVKVKVGSIPDLPVCEKSGTHATGGSLIQVPDVRMCHNCKIVFQSTVALEEHIVQKHSGKSDSVPEPPTLVAEQPLDLRSSPGSLPSPINLSKLTLAAEDCLELAADVEAASSPLQPAAVCCKQSQPVPVPKAKKHVCLVCLQEFFDTDVLLTHQTERHANIDCRHMEVDVDFTTNAIRRSPNVLGLLNISSSQLPSLHGDRVDDIRADDVTCTKCRRSFPSRSALHMHIVECGDYWRNLPERLTWVFVLRGSQIPAPTGSGSSSSSKPKSKQRGKYRWGTISSSGDALRRRLQRMLLREHVAAASAGGSNVTAMGSLPNGSVAASAVATSNALTLSPSVKSSTVGVSGSGSASRRASARISSRRSSDSPPPVISTADSADTWKDGKRTSVAGAYANLGKNIGQTQRRQGSRRFGGIVLPNAAVNEMPSSTDIIMQSILCEWCSCAFQSSDELATHMTLCGQNERKQSAGQDDAIAASDAKEDEEDVYDPTKHMCIYCCRQFTFLRALRRHVPETCPTRRELIENNEYIDEEWEAQLAASAPGSCGTSLPSCSVGGKSVNLMTGESVDEGGAEGGNGRSGGGGSAKRRRRCNNWTSSKSRSKRSARSSDDADDSLFGWEDAYMNSWGKDEREDITKKARADANQFSASEISPITKLNSDMIDSISEERKNGPDASSVDVPEQNVATVDIESTNFFESTGKSNRSENGNDMSSTGQQDSADLAHRDSCRHVEGMTVTSGEQNEAAMTTVGEMVSGACDEQSASQRVAASALESDRVAGQASSTDADRPQSDTNSASLDGPEADPEKDADDAVSEPHTKKTRRRKGRRLTMVKRRKS